MHRDTSPKEKLLAPSRMTPDEMRAFARACEQPKKTIALTDPVLDVTDAHTRLLLLAEYWQREAIAARKALINQRESAPPTTEAKP